MLSRLLASLTFVMLSPTAFAGERSALPNPWTTTVIPARAVAPSKPTPPPTTPAGHEHALKGIASYYWHGEKTASGEPFDKTALTAAHRTLPFNTLVKVTALNTRQSVVVRINDRGPFKQGRVIDVSQRAAEVLGFERRGLTMVEIEVLR